MGPFLWKLFQFGIIAAIVGGAQLVFGESRNGYVLLFYVCIGVGVAFGATIMLTWIGSRLTAERHPEQTTRAMPRTGSDAAPRTEFLERENSQRLEP